MMFCNINATITDPYGASRNFGPLGQLKENILHVSCFCVDLQSMTYEYTPETPFVESKNLSDFFLR